MAGPGLYSTIEATVKSYVSSYAEAVQVNDASILSRALAPECQRELTPASMFRTIDIPFNPKMGNAAYETHMTKEIEFLEYAKAEIVNLMVDTVGRKAGARSSHTLKLKNGSAHVVEFCWFLDLTNDGTKIKYITQFVDATGGASFLAEMKQVASQGAKDE